MGVVTVAALFLRAFLVPRAVIAAENLALHQQLAIRVIVLNEAHLIRILRAYFAYYHEARTHLSLDRNAPIPRTVEPPSQGRVIAIPQVGGLHHRYRRAV
jgi:putative transposase